METQHCGTRYGNNLHRKQGETPCELCKTAANLYLKNWRKTTLKLLNPEYVAKQKEVSTQRSLEWAKQNPERIKENQKKFRAVHPEVGREHKRRRRARKLANGYEIYTEEQVLDTYGTNCHICAEPIDLEASRSTGAEGWEKGLHIDHVIPISKGGPDTLGNVRPAHGLCNLEKSHFYQEVD